MSKQASEHDPLSQAGPQGDSISPLPGEPGIPDVTKRRRLSWSKKGLLAVGLLLLCLLSVSAFFVQRFTAGGKKPDDEQTKLASDKPSAATSEPRRLEIPV